MTVRFGRRTNGGDDKFGITLQGNRIHKAVMVDEATERLAFELSSGPGYLELKLQDGAVLHVHPIVMDIHKSSKLDEHGKPVYLVTGGLAVRVMPGAVEST